MRGPVTAEYQQIPCKSIPNINSVWGNCKDSTIVAPKSSPPDEIGKGCSKVPQQLPRKKWGEHELVIQQEDSES